MDEQKITAEQINKTQSLLHHFNSRAIRILNHCSILQWHFTHSDLNTEGANQTFTYLNDEAKSLPKELKILSDFFRKNFDIKGDFEVDDK